MRIPRFFKKGWKIYLPHPAHKTFVKIDGPVLADVHVFDYWAETD